jgi:hypothetical protein
MSHFIAHAASKDVTFFCNRTTLVHFFSNSPSYFFRVASSKVDEMFTSSRKAAAVLGAFMTPRYAIIALCLPVDQHGRVGPCLEMASLTAPPPGGQSVWRSWRRRLLMHEQRGQTPCTIVGGASLQCARRSVWPHF